MIRVLLTGIFCLMTIYAFGQKDNLMCKEVKGKKSKISDHKIIGIMDTTLFLVQGKVTKQKDVEDSPVLEGIQVSLTNVTNGQSISALTDKNGNFKIWGFQGIYNLDVTYIGLDRLVIKKLKIGLGEIRLINIVLGLGTYHIMVNK